MSDVVATPPLSELAQLESLAISYPAHRDHYYPDGSLVLLVGKEGSEDAVKFRVHHGIIVKHSTIFKDMFSIGSHCATGFGADEEPGVDGEESPPPSPSSSSTSSSRSRSKSVRADIILHLPDDDPKGFQNILNTIYDIQFMLLTLPRMLHNKDFHQYLTIIDSMLVLVDKYHFHTLHEPLSFALHRIAPVSPDAMIQRLQMLPWGDAAALNAQRTHCITLIELARKHGIPELLPAAFYTIISICTPKEVYELESLSWQDRCRCVVGAYEVCLKMTQHSGHAPLRALNFGQTYSHQQIPPLQPSPAQPMVPAGPPPGPPPASLPGGLPMAPGPVMNAAQPGSLAALVQAHNAASLNQGGINPFWAPRDLGRVSLVAKNATWNTLPAVFQLGDNWEELRKSSSLRVGTSGCGL